MGRLVYVPQARWERWLANFEDSHGETVVEAAGATLRGRADDGSTFEATWPWGADAPGPAMAPDRWGVLLVRKGGFAIARLAGGELQEHKVGQRHVQGRTKAGGQSQQRFARRRDNQARAAFEAAADHAARILAGVTTVVTGGDRTGLADVLDDPRLAHVGVVGTLVDVPEPRRRELDRAIENAQAVLVDVTNA